MSEYIVPVFILFVILIGVIERKNIYELFVLGAKDGLKTALNIFPYIFAIMILARLVSDTGILTNITIFGIDADLLPLILMKPLSGGAATSIVVDIFERHGTDGFSGMVASILMASTETTLYVISILSSKIKATNLKIVIICGLIGDFVAVILTIIIVKYIFIL